MTTSVTRPIIIADLVKIMRETPDVCCDYDTLGEMLTFVKNEHGRPEAMDGEHDDLVMSFAITHYIRHQQRYSAAKERPPAKYNFSVEKPKPSALGTVTEDFFKGGY